VIAIILFLLSAGHASAAPSGSLFGISLVEGKGGGSIGVPMQITILMTLLALLPAAFMSVTPFLRISVVLHFLRQALGTQTTPSNQVLVGLSMFLTMLSSAPSSRRSTPTPGSRSNGGRSRRSKRSMKPPNRSRDF
jgi:flagellar biosynthetic protein FliP